MARAGNSARIWSIGKSGIGCPSESCTRFNRPSRDPDESQNVLRGSMNTTRANLRTRCSWIPDQVRDDGQGVDRGLARAVVRLFQVERRRGIGVAGLATV